jgi:HdeA/HdeB family
MRTLAALLALALVALAITAATGMGVMVRATGPYNINCEEFAKAKPAQRERALAFAQGYFAAQNMELDVDSQIDLQERWRELNTYITRACTDKSNPYLHRRFVNDAADEAFEKMSNRKRQLPTTN